MSFLIASDDTQLRLQIAGKLKSLDGRFALKFSATALDAIDTLKQEKIRAVFLALSGENQQQLLSLVRILYPTLPVVFVTGTAPATLGRFDLWLPLPISLLGLTNVMEKIKRLSREAKESAALTHFRRKPRKIKAAAKNINITVCAGPEFLKFTLPLPEHSKVADAVAQVGKNWRQPTIERGGQKITIDSETPLLDGDVLFVQPGETS